MVGPLSSRLAACAVVVLIAFGCCVAKADTQRRQQRDMHDAILRTWQELKAMKTKADLNTATKGGGDARAKELGVFDECVRQTEAIDISECPREFQNAFNEYVMSLKNWRGVRASKSEDDLNALIGQSTMEYASLGFMGYEGTEALAQYRKKLKEASDAFMSKLMAAHAIATRLGSAPVEELKKIEEQKK